MKKYSLVILVIIIFVVTAIYCYNIGLDDYCCPDHHDDITSMVVSTSEVKPIINIDAPFHRYENLFLFFQIVLGVGIFATAFYFLKKNKNNK